MRITRTINKVKPTASGEVKQGNKQKESRGIEGEIRQRNISAH